MRVSYGLLGAGLVALITWLLTRMSRDRLSVARYRSARQSLGAVVERASADMQAPSVGGAPAEHTSSERAAPGGHRAPARVGPLRVGPQDMGPRRSRSWRHGGLAVAAGLIGVAGLLMVTLVSGDRSDPQDGSTTAPTTPQPPPASAPTTAPVPTTATVSVAEPVAFDAGQAVYPADSSVSLLIVARGPCWVGVQDADGTDGVQVTLEAGDQQVIEGDTPLRVRLGNPTVVEVVIDGTPARVPATEGQPFDLVLGDPP
jgi:hypothetical protein